MHKLVILIFSTRSPQFDAHWPDFLHAAERIPGLRREATSRVSRVLYGQPRCELIHELFFDSYAELESGLNSPQGRQAGELLQAITGGRMTLLLAEHNEDDGESLRQYQAGPPASEPS
jgi:uncharacterized protein (TIGR02118 family)